MPLNDKIPAKVEAFVEEQRGMGAGILGIVPSYTGPDDDAPPEDYPTWREWDRHRNWRRNPQLVLVEPDPYPQLDDLAAVTFTPEVAIAQVKEHPHRWPRARLVGPELHVKAALMTMPEAFELIEHGIPPGALGTVPGRLVTVVVAHGLFEVMPPRHAPWQHQPEGYTPPPPEVREAWFFQVCDSRRGGGFWQGGGGWKEIVLPEQ